MRRCDSWNKRSRLRVTAEVRVPDPNATSPYIPDPSYLDNEVLGINIGDMQDAIRAEAVIDP